MRPANPLENENGAALVTGLMFLAILAMLGATAVLMTTTDLQIGANYKASAVALNDAEAGINFGIREMEAGLADGSFVLPTATGGASTLNYAVPSGFSFTISDVTMLGTNAYSFTSTGRGPNNAACVIEVTVKRAPAIAFAAFGDEYMVTKNSATVYSYDSRTSPPPSGPGDSTHEGDIGSNDKLETKNNSFIDGDGVLGEQDDGSDTIDKIHDYGDFFGDAPVDAGRIDPDPLGVNSGGEYDPTTYSAANDNNLATSPTYPAGGAFEGNTRLELGSSFTDTEMTLHGKAGGANYYVTRIELKNSTTLKIDTTNGPVRLFLDNPTTSPSAFDIKNSASINVIPSTAAHDFAVFSNYTGIMDIKHNGHFDGLLYAPYADIVTHNSGDVNGALWGKSVDIRNSGVLNYNTALADLYPSKHLTKTSWHYVRD